MADKHDHLHENGSREVSGETIRRFLLGHLSASEQTAFEQRLFSEDSLDNRVRLAELDLADDYAYGRLTDAERAEFEEKFLVSADRRRQVEVSSILRERFATASRLKTKSRFVERLRVLPALTRPVWRYAFAAAILLILLGTAWLVTKEPHLAEQIRTRFVPRRSSPRSAPKDMNHPTNPPSAEHQTTPSPLPVHDQTSSSQATVAWVTAASSNNNLPSVALPQGDDAIVRVQIAVKPEEGGTFRGELVSADGQSVYGSESLKTADNDGSQIIFDIPARVLKTGNYAIRLGRDNASAKENVGSFYFRVQ